MFLGPLWSKWALVAMRAVAVKGRSGDQSSYSSSVQFTFEHRHEEAAATASCGMKSLGIP